MPMPDAIMNGSPIVLFNEKFGYVRAWAAEDANFGPGNLALFKVMINSESMPGVTESTININNWKVYKADDPKLIKLLLDQFVPYQYSR